MKIMDQIRQYGLFSGIPLQYQLFISTIVSLVTVGYLFGGDLSAQWGIIDDHEIMMFIGDKSHLQLSEFFPKLMETEVGEFGIFPRYRPAYYTLRLLECWVWGKNPLLWYGFRLGIFSFFLVTIWVVITPKIGFSIAGLMTLFIATEKFWADVFARIGPSEIYTVLGLALFIIGFEKSYKYSKTVLGPFFLFLGTVIAAGSKENFTLLIIPLIFLFSRSVINRTGNLSTLWLIAISMSWCFFIGVAVIISTNAQGVDIYGNSVQLSGRLDLLLSALTRRTSLLLFAIFVFYLITGIFLARFRRELARLSIIAGAWTGALIFFYSSQVVFYNGIWPTHSTRYDFPGMLYVPVIFVVLFWYLQRVFTAIPGLVSYSRFLVFMSAGICIVLISSHLSNISYIRNEVQKNVDYTVRFSKKVARLTQLANKNLNYALVIQSNNIVDYEPVIGYQRFLAATGVKNSMFLLWIADSTKPSVLNDALNNALVELSKEGSKGIYLPLREASAYGSKCILVVLSGSAEWPCEVQFDGAWR